MKIIYLKKSANVVVVVGALILGLTTCVWGDDVKETEDAKEEWGAMLEGCQVSIQSEKDIFAYCEPIILKIAIRNNGAEPVLLIVARPDKDCIAIVKNSKGKAVPLTAYGRHLSDSLLGGFDHGVHLDPGQKREYTLLVNRIHDMTRKDTYSIVVKCVVPKQDGKGYAEVTSNTIPVVVKGQPPNPFDDNKSK